MGQDYLARKQVKKQRKRDARNAEMPGRGKKRKQHGKDGLDVVGEDEGLLAPGEARRRRKKGNNVSLRISRCVTVLSCVIIQHATTLVTLSHASVHQSKHAVIFREELSSVIRIVSSR
jgi:hypothetical protein